jgi:hypothetical protein
MHTPPEEMVTRGDHSGLASHYTREALALRQKAEGWEALADFYERHQFPHGKLDPKEHATHCRAIAGAYRKAADEAQALANAHRGEISQGLTQ